MVLLAANKQSLHTHLRRTSYPSSTFLVKYYQQTTQAAVTEMIAEDIDFGVTAVGLTASRALSLSFTSPHGTSPSLSFNG